MSDPKSGAANAKTKAFKPRAGIVRKSKAERDAHAKQEAEKAAARAAIAVQATRKPTSTTKSNAGKKREPQRDGSHSTGGGVFGAGSGVRPSRTRSALDSGYSEMLEGQEGVTPSDVPVAQSQERGPSTQQKADGSSGTQTAVSTKRSTVPRQTRGGLQFEPDDEPDEDRRDIERIWISSDEEPAQDTDTTRTAKGKGRETSEGRKTKQSLSLRPVRAPRILAEDDEAELERKDDKRAVKSSRMVIEDVDGHDAADHMEIDDEPAGEAAQLKQDIPSSPELSKRIKPGRKTGTRTKDSKLATETIEERAERIRLNKDIEKLRDEFLTPRTIKTENDTDPDEESRKHDGKLFLFQFPPLVPFLADQATISTDGLYKKPSTPEDGLTIKNDPEGSAVLGDSTDKGDTGSATSILKPQIEGLLTANDLIRLPPGLVGKLKIHKSGKVTLDWGGTDMEVRHGTDVDFLQDAVLVETPGQPVDGEEKSAGIQTGTTYALGQVRKKMIVIPDWQKLYD